ncbi:MAG: NAD(P)/FAD-dependent oxidoreductase [bacterium]|nr:NAD(P)/FAD-dependent oxidoreductase [bacterium]
MADKIRSEVLVIGAGPAGICAAYWLAKRAIPYRVVDQAAVVGSTWAHLYPSLQLNTLSLNSHLPGALIPLRYGFFPLGRQYYDYLTRYVRARQFNITLNVTVTRVSPEGDGWRVESSEGVDQYPAVIVAAGRFNNPYFPSIPGADTFRGQVIHASAFHDPQDYAGQRVMVVGNGPSGGDIAAALATYAARPVLLAVRSDVVLARKYPFGLPHAVWAYAIHALPKPLRKPLTNALVYQGYPGMKSLPIRFAPNRDDRQGTSAPIRGRELYDALKQGGVVGVAGLAALRERCAVLNDGSEHPVDVVILSTGYRPALGFLDVPFATDGEGWPLRAVDPVYGAEGMQIAGYRGLYLVGRFYRGRGALRNFRYEAKIAAHQIERDFRLH